MLGIDELDELLDEIRKKVLIANRDGTLDDILEKLGLYAYIQTPARYESYKSGKIFVFGAPTVKEKDLRAIAESVGIDKNRIEFFLDYERVKNYDFRRNLQYNDKVRVVLVGALPHSTSGKGDSSSIIAELESKDGYPRLVRLRNGSELKITKTNFREALQKLLNEDYI